MATLNVIFRFQNCVADHGDDLRHDSVA